MSFLFIKRFKQQLIPIPLFDLTELGLDDWLEPLLDWSGIGDGLFLCESLLPLIILVEFSNLYSLSPE